MNNVAELKFQAVIFGRDAIYLEGVRPVKIDNTEMIFKSGCSVITVAGEKLGIKELDGDTVSVTGRVSDFSVRDL